MRLDVITIFPEYLEPLRHALLGKAIEDGLLTVGVHQLRDYATGTHRAVDDAPLGGGPGMVMKPEVWAKALTAVLAGEAGQTLSSPKPHVARPRHDELQGIKPRGYRVDPTQFDPSRPVVLVPTPTGQVFSQKMAQQLSTAQHLIFACGRYEGIDERVWSWAEDQGAQVIQVSLGDYVLIGGEVAALVMSEAICRLIPGVLGNSESHEDDSFSAGLLEAPSYTRPALWEGYAAPAVLLSGDHQQIAAFRREQALLRTKERRPDLLASPEVKASLSVTDQLVLTGQKLTVTRKVPGWCANRKQRQSWLKKQDAQLKAQFPIVQIQHSYHAEQALVVSELAWLEQELTPQQLQEQLAALWQLV